MAFSRVTDFTSGKFTDGKFSWSAVAENNRNGTPSKTLWIEGSVGKPTNEKLSLDTAHAVREQLVDLISKL